MATNDYNAFDNSAQPGLFDFSSEQDILAQKAQQRQANTMALLKQINAATPADRTAGILGGLVGNAIGNKFSPPTLTASERLRTDAVSATTQRLNQWKDANPDASAEDIGLNTQKFMSEELLSRGQLQQGIPMAQMYAQQANAKRMADLEAQKLGYENTQLKNQTTYWNLKNTMQRVMLRAPGETEPRDVFVDEKGNATYTNDQGQPVSTPLGQYYRVPDNWKEGKDVKPLDLGYNSQYMTKIRNLGNAIPNTVMSLDRMYSAMQQDIKANGSVNFLDKAGNGVSWVSDWANNITGLARNAGSFLGVGENHKDLSTKEGADAWVKLHPELVDEMKAQMPENVRQTTQARDRWLSAATQMTYAKHQSLVPGDRGISDKEFIIDMKSTGALTTDPEAFRQVTLDNFKQQVAGYEQELLSMPDSIQKLVMAPAGRERFDASIARFHEMFDQPIGSAANPNPKMKGEDVVNRILGTAP